MKEGRKLYHQRSAKIRTIALSQEQIEVYALCDNPVTIQDLLSLTSAKEDKIKAILEFLISQELIVTFGKQQLKKSNSVKKRDPEFYQLRQRLESFLVEKLPPKKAIAFSKELNTCSNEPDLRATGQRIATLIDKSIGEEMLNLLDLNS